MYVYSRNQTVRNQTEPFLCGFYKDHENQSINNISSSMTTIDRIRKLHALCIMIPDAWKNWTNTNRRERYSLVLVVVYRDRMNSCDLVQSQGNPVVEDDYVVLNWQPSQQPEQDSARHFVTDSVEDETAGNATEALVDFVSAGLVAADVRCAQPRRTFVFVNILLN